MKREIMIKSRRIELSFMEACYFLIGYGIFMTSLHHIEWTVTE